MAICNCWMMCRTSVLVEIEEPKTGASAMVYDETVHWYPPSQHFKSVKDSVMSCGVSYSEYHGTPNERNRKFRHTLTGRGEIVVTCDHCLKLGTYDPFDTSTDNIEKDMRVHWLTKEQYDQADLASKMVCGVDYLTPNRKHKHWRMLGDNSQKHSKCSHQCITLHPEVTCTQCLVLATQIVRID
jgi:hypothetical protein